MFLCEMSHVIESKPNIRARMGLVGRVMLSSLTAATCFMLPLVNGTVLFSLRSKPVAHETSAYLLLLNLLATNTLQLVVSPTLCGLSASRIRLMYSFCGFLVGLADVASEISPFALPGLAQKARSTLLLQLLHLVQLRVRLRLPGCHQDSARWSGQPSVLVFCCCPHVCALKDRTIRPLPHPCVLLTLSAKRSQLGLMSEG